MATISAEASLNAARDLARALYANPPTHGARIAAEVVNDPELFAVRWWWGRRRRPPTFLLSPPPF